MNRYKIAKLLSLITILVSLLVIFGWIFDIPILTSILPQWVTMKFTTAVSFLLSGGILYYSIKKFNNEQSVYGLTIPVFSVLLLFVMGVLLLSVFIGARTGIEDLFVQETADTVFTTTPGRPSVGTMISFILIGLIGIFFLYDFKYLGRINMFFGLVIGVIGLIALLGYLLNLSFLYYAIENFSTAMAVHTAILFVILGIGFFVISINDNLKDETKNRYN